MKTISINFMGAPGDSASTNSIAESFVPTVKGKFIACGQDGEDPSDADRQGSNVEHPDLFLTNATWADYPLIEPEAASFRCPPNELNTKRLR
jgi:hypothetical protein